MDVDHSIHLLHSTGGEHSDGRVGYGGWKWGDKIGADETEPMSVAYYRKAARLPKKEMLFVSNR